MGQNVSMGTVIRRILSDVRVELTEEFDKNFERQAFFTEAWERRKSPMKPGRATLTDTGGLRRSIHSRSTADSITFYSDLPYAAIHNEGGEIKVTQKMKKYFWYRYKQTQGGFGRKKNGEKRNDKRNERLDTEATFWKYMALMKVGQTIKIPKRQFLGAHPDVEKAVREIIEANLEEFFNNYNITSQ